MKYRYYIKTKRYIHVYIYVYMYILSTEEHCHILICVQHVQWLSNTRWFGNPSMSENCSCAMFLELPAMDCSPIVTEKGNIVTSTFLTYCHISLSLSLTCTEYIHTHTHTHSTSLGYETIPFSFPSLTNFPKLITTKRRSVGVADASELHGP